MKNLPFSPDFCTGKKCKSWRKVKKYIKKWYFYFDEDLKKVFIKKDGFVLVY